MALSDPTLKSPMVLTMHVPQRTGAILAGLHLIKSNAGVTALECSYHLTPTALTALLALLSDHPSRLQFLSLRSTHACTSPEAAGHLVSVLREATRLQELCVPCLWAAGEDVAVAILCAAATCPLLRVLDVSGCQLGPRACTTLGRSLLRWTHLQRLDIAACSITDAVRDLSCVVCSLFASLLRLWMSFVFL